MRAFIFVLVAVLSIISQIPVIVLSPIGDWLKALWVIPFILSLFDIKSTRIEGLLAFSLFFFLFAIFCLTLESITGTQYVGADFRNIAISFVIFVTSYLTFSSGSGPAIVKHLPLCLLMVGFFVSVFIVLNYELVGSLNTSLYAYKEKNSMSTILVAIIVLSGYLFKPNATIWKLIKGLLMLIVSVVVLLLRSRATILGLFFAIYYYILALTNKRIKYLSIFLLILAVVLIVFIPSLNTVFWNQIMLAGRDQFDINDLSSNRVENIPALINLLSAHPFTGNGNMYFDCMPLIMLTQYGILGASIVFCFLLRIFVSLYKNRKCDSIHISAFVLYCVFLINSLFEAQPPFGPGIKCYLLWVMVGFAFAIDFATNRNSII